MPSVVSFGVVCTPRSVSSLVACADISLILGVAWMNAAIMSGGGLVWLLVSKTSGVVWVVHSLMCVILVGAYTSSWTADDDRQDVDFFCFLAGFISSPPDILTVGSFSPACESCSLVNPDNVCVMTSSWEGGGLVWLRTSVRNSLDDCIEVSRTSMVVWLSLVDNIGGSL